jgi:putative ABC transport system ATP-binding protein
MAIVGKSGSGKSTLLHICATFLSPNGGNIELFGEDLYSKSQPHIEQLRRYDIGIVFQSHYLFKGMSGLENIKIATLLSDERIDESLLELLDIKECINQKIGELSGGQQQRVSIARVLSKKPRIIFADEPTGNLDNQTASLVMDAFLEYIHTHNASLMLVTHDMDIAHRCNDIYHLQDRQLIKN